MKAVHSWFLMVLVLTSGLPGTGWAQEEDGERPVPERIPFETTVATFGDFELGVGYYFHYDRDRVRELVQLPPMDRVPALKDGIRSAMFHHLLAEQALEAGYDETEEYRTQTLSMEMEWLSRFYSYNEFDLKYVPDEEKLQALYEERKDEFFKPMTFSFRHVFFQTRDRSEQQVEEAMTLAKEALALIESGSDFVTVAEEYSESERKGNVVGPFKTREEDPDRAINPVLEEALLAMNPGETSGIVETRHGYHILKLEKVTPETYTPFTSARAGLLSEQRREDMIAWQKSLLEANADHVHTVNAEALFDESAGPDTIVLHVFDTELTKADFETSHGGVMRQRQGQSDEDWREQVMERFTNTFVYSAIAMNLALQKNYDEIQGYQVFTDALRVRNVYQVWLDRLWEEHLEVNPITDEMIATFYEETPVAFRKPQQVRVAEMTFPIPEHDEEDRYQAFLAQSGAQSKAEEAIARLQEGESFADVARDLSESATAFKGGDLGLIDANTDLLPAVVARRAIRLEEGDISEEPIRSNNAFYVVMTVDKPDVELYPLESDEAQEAATRALTSRLRTEFVNRLYDEMVPEDEVELVIDNADQLDASKIEQMQLTP